MTTYPNVPDAPGVPPVLRATPSQIGAPTPITLMNADAPNVSTTSGPSEWGIYLKNSAVITANSVISMEYKQEWKVANYPLEKGAFESYDKVQLPFEGRVRFATGGTESDRALLLNTIDGVANTLELYDLVTPEKTYTSVNVTHYDYKRAAQNGLGLLQVDVWVTQVRVTATATSPSTAQPSGAAPVNGGRVQPQQVTSPEQNLFSGNIPNIATVPSTATNAAGLPSTPTSFSTNIAPVASSDPTIGAVAGVNTPVQAANGPQFDNIPRDAQGTVLTGSQAQTQATYTSNTFTGGTIVTDPASGAYVTQIPTIVTPH